MTGTGRPRTARSIAGVVVARALAGGLAGVLFGLLFGAVASVLGTGTFGVGLAAWGFVIGGVLGALRAAMRIAAGAEGRVRRPAR